MTAPKLDDILEEVGLGHSGIKGMKWGIRRKNPSGSDGSSAASAKAKESYATTSIKRSQLKGLTDASGSPIKLKRGTFVNAKGEKLDYDAVEARMIAKKLIENPGKVSNKEMQSLINRLNLEQSYNKLNPPPEGKTKWLKDLIKDTGKARTKDLLDSTSRTALNKQLVKRNLEPIIKPSKDKNKNDGFSNDDVAKIVKDAVDKAVKDTAKSTARDTSSTPPPQNPPGASRNAGGQRPPPRARQNTNSSEPRRPALPSPPPPSPIINLRNNGDGSFG